MPHTGHICCFDCALALWWTGNLSCIIIKFVVGLTNNIHAMKVCVFNAWYNLSPHVWRALDTFLSYQLINILAAEIPYSVSDAQQRSSFSISAWRAGRHADGSCSLWFLWISVGGWLTSRLAFPQRHKEWQKLRKTKAHQNPKWLVQ